MSQNFDTCYSMLSNMRAYEQKCHFGLIFFYSLFSLPSLHFILFSSLSVTLYLFPLSPPCSRSLSSLLKISRRLTLPSTSTALATDLHSPCRWPLDLLIGSWVWDLGWVSMCGFWVIDWSVGLGFWTGGGIVVVAVVGWVLGRQCLWL